MTAPHTTPAPAGTGTTDRHQEWRTWYATGLTVLAAYSTAIAWQAQLVSYPLYRAVGADEFLDYHDRYNHSIPAVVIAPGFLTFLGAIALVGFRPSWIDRRLTWFVGACGATSLLVTVLWAIPRHDELDRVGRSAATIDSLVKANAVRTAAMTAMAVALGWAVGRQLVRRDADLG